MSERSFARSGAGSRVDWVSDLLVTAMGGPSLRRDRVMDHQMSSPKLAAAVSPWHERETGSVPGDTSNALDGKDALRHGKPDLFLA